MNLNMEMKLYILRYNYFLELIAINVNVTPILHGSVVEEIVARKVK